MKNVSGRDPDLKPDRSNRARLAAALRAFIAEAVVRDAPDEELAAAAEAAESFTKELIGTPRRPRSVGPLMNENGEITGFDYGRDMPDFSPVSGRVNPLSPGLQMHLEARESEEASTEDVAVGSVRFPASFEGSPGSVHGGYVAAVFDELFGLTLSSTEKPGMTGTLTVRFENPCPVDTQLRLEGRVRKMSGRKIITEATMHAGDELVAEAEALFVTVDLERYEGFAKARDE